MEHEEEPRRIDPKRFAPDSEEVKRTKACSHRLAKLAERYPDIAGFDIISTGATVDIHVRVSPTLHRDAETSRERRESAFDVLTEFARRAKVEQAPTEVDANREEGRYEPTLRFPGGLTDLEAALDAGGLPRRPTLRQPEPDPSIAASR